MTLAPRDRGGAGEPRASAAAGDGPGSGLRAILRTRIEAHGPLSVADWMAECLLHPRHGYYATRDPLGSAGDFTTAPEISQVFGELIGLCLAQAWLDRGRPRPVRLVELGPGRGTLMADALRAARAVPGFSDAATLHLVEASPVLRAAQARALSAHAPFWHQRLEDVPEGPLMLVANEFLDALPVRQFVRHGPAWRERVVGLAPREPAAASGSRSERAARSAGGAPATEASGGTGMDPSEGAAGGRGGDAHGIRGRLCFGLAPPLAPPFLAHRLADTQEGEVVEWRPAVPALMAEVERRIARGGGGAALLIDYGGWRSRGDTLQALRGHAFADPLDAPGEADLTAHVDFEAVARAAPALAASGLTAQGAFLERLGATARARALARDLSGEALARAAAAHRRLTHPDEMGTLFKVLALWRPGEPGPPGLDPPAAP